MPGPIIGTPTATSILRDAGVSARDIRALQTLAEEAARGPLNRHQLDLLDRILARNPALVSAQERAAIDFAARLAEHGLEQRQILAETARNRAGPLTETINSILTDPGSASARRALMLAAAFGHVFRLFRDAGAVNVLPNPLGIVPGMLGADGIRRMNDADELYFDSVRDQYERTHRFGPGEFTGAVFRDPAFVGPIAEIEGTTMPDIDRPGALNGTITRLDLLRQRQGLGQFSWGQVDFAIKCCQEADTLRAAYTRWVAAVRRGSGEGARTRGGILQDIDICFGEGLAFERVGGEFGPMPRRDEGGGPDDWRGGGSGFDRGEGGSGGGDWSGGGIAEDRERWGAGIGGSWDVGPRGPIPEPGRNVGVFGVETIETERDAKVTTVPKAFRYHAKRSSKGGYVVIFKEEVVARFIRKKQAHGFARHMNSAVSVLGGAFEFPIRQLSDSFQYVLAEGSGDAGIIQGFSSGLHGYV